MAKSRRDAAFMFWAAVALAVLLGVSVGPRASLLGVALGLFSGIQWLMYVNRDINRDQEAPPRT